MSDSSTYVFTEMTPRTEDSDTDDGADLMVTQGSGLEAEADIPPRTLDEACIHTGRRRRSRVYQGERRIAEQFAAARRR